jgi:Putative beta-barrel porin-2, OmpL-like. bbp2
VIKLRPQRFWVLSLAFAAVFLAGVKAAAQATPPSEMPPQPPPPMPAPAVVAPAPLATLPPAPPAPAAAPAAAAPNPPAQTTNDTEPFAWGDFTWLNGNSRQTKAPLDTTYFTPEILMDVNYTSSLNNPIDDTVVGSTALSRNNEFTLAFMGFGGDFHYDNARARIMTQFGVRSTLVPRNDFSATRGQFDLYTALRYVSEAYGGFHLPYMHGINIDAGIFMSYVGLFSYDNYENWMYLPSFTSDNTPWFFNGIRVQTFPTDKLKVELWIINGWQTYAKFNTMPGFGTQILYRPVEYLSFISNDYVGWDTQDGPARIRFHSDNSFQWREFQDTTGKSPILRAAMSITADIGGESGGAANGYVTPFGGSGKENGCTQATPCTQHFLSAMMYQRVWFSKEWAVTAGGGVMNNPGRYLVLAPTGNASPVGIVQPAGTQPATQPFDLNPGTTFNAWDYEAGFQWMPSEQFTFDCEFNHRQANTDYFAGHGGVTSPDGYITTTSLPGWRPDLVKADTRIIFAALTRF